MYYNVCKISYNALQGYQLFNVKPNIIKHIFKIAFNNSSKMLLIIHHHHLLTLHIHRVSQLA